MKTFFIFLLLLSITACNQRDNGDIAPESPTPESPGAIINKLEDDLALLKSEFGIVEKHAMHYYTRAKAATPGEDLNTALEGLRVAVDKCAVLQEKVDSLLTGHTVEFLVENRISAALPFGWCDVNLLKAVTPTPDEPTLADTLESMPVDPEKIKEDTLLTWASDMFEKADIASDNRMIYVRYYKSAKNTDAKKIWAQKARLAAEHCSAIIDEYHNVVNKHTIEELKSKGIRPSIRISWCEIEPEWLQ